MTGKEKCRILKQIREQIAKENDIDLVVAECTHKGECRGTCPRCESEVRYLEEQLEKRRRLRRNVALAGISAGVVASLAGCSVVEGIKDIIGGGDVVGLIEGPYVTEEPLDGEVVCVTGPEEPVELMGDVAYMPEDGEA